MNLDPGNIIELAIAASVFVLVLAVWFMAVLAWSRRRASHAERMGDRLALSEQSSNATRTLRLWHGGEEVTTKVPEGRRRGLPARLDLVLEEAGLEMRSTAFIVAMFGATVLATVLTYVLVNNALLGLGISAGGIMILWVYLKSRASRRVVLFERQFVDALELAARSLRAGHPLGGAFRLIAQEVKAPVGPLFAEVCQQQDLGMNLEEALRNATARSRSADARIFVASVVIQLRTGGNLADMMDRVAYVIRDRMKLSRRVRVLTAQTQFSKRVLLVLPFAIFMALNLVNAEYMAPLYSTRMGQTLLAGAVVSMMFGAWVMNRIAILRY